MSIIRSPRPTSNYIVISKDVTEDKRLSWSARGMLIYLLGKPDNWTVSVANLVNQTDKSERKAGRDAVYSIINELLRVGYIKRADQSRSAGKFGGVDYVLFDSPELAESSSFLDEESPTTDEPYTDFPHTANPTQTSNDLKQVFTGTNKKNNASACEEVGRQAEQERIHELTKPCQPNKGDFVIDFDWQPTQAFKTECMRAGKDASAVTKDMLGQFINHYRTKGHVKDQRAYEGLLLSWLMRELAKPKPSTSTPRAYSRNQYHDPILDNPDAKMQPDHIMGQDNEAVKNRVPPADFKNKMANLKNLLEQ